MEPRHGGHGAEVELVGAAQPQHLQVLGQLVERAHGPSGHHPAAEPHQRADLPSSKAEVRSKSIVNTKHRCMHENNAVASTETILNADMFSLHIKDTNSSRHAHVH